MATVLKRVSTILAAVLLLGIGSGPLSHRAAAAEQKVHRLAIQVDVNDPAVMNLALNNAANAVRYYSGRGEEVSVNIVAYGPGLHMLREDTSPVKARVESFHESMPNITFSACNNTKRGMEKREGKKITLVPAATVVPSGVVRLVELQEQGWSYVRP